MLGNYRLIRSERFLPKHLVDSGGFLVTMMIAYPIPTLCCHNQYGSRLQNSPYFSVSKSNHKGSGMIERENYVGL